MTREEAMKRLKEARFTVQPYQYINEALDTAIKALEQEPKTGHWIKTGYVDKVTCSICRRKMWNYWEVNDFNYCPNCGAKMAESDCRDCKEYKDCPCGKDGHESGTSQGYSIGECKNFEPQERGDQE